MEDDSTKGNVIKGPWKNLKRSGRKINVPTDIEKATEDLYFVDELTEALLVQLIHTSSENGFNIKSEKFIKDIGFISECVKATLLRQMKYKHPVSFLMDKIMSMTTRQEDSLDKNYTQFDFKELSRLLGEKDNETKEE